MPRLPFLFLAIACLLIGIVTGLARAGVVTPDWLSIHTGFHSIFMISGFFGTVIGLERAVAIHKPWAFIAPLMSAFGALLILMNQPESLAASLFVIAGCVFTTANIRVTLIQPAIYTITLLTGAGLWLVGNTGWLISDNAWISIPFGLSFLVLTIAGERLEMTRFLPPRKYATYAFLCISGLLLVGTFMSALTSFGNNTLLGLSYALLALWLMQFDIVRKTIRKAGITRFVAVCLLNGYLWLLIGGIFLGDVLNVGSYQRDAAIHAIGLGFIFSMVIGHAPIIFPAVVRLAIPFSGIFYIPLAVINLGLVLRFAATVVSSHEMRQAGAILSAVAIITFLACVITQILRGMRRTVNDY